MSWRVEVQWHGRRWTAEDAPVEVVESVDLLSTTYTYRPRRLRVVMDLGHVQDLVARGVAAVDSWVRFTYQGRLVGEGPAAFDAGRGGELTTVYLGEVEPVITSGEVPPTYDMTIRRLDRARTNRRRQRWREWEAEKARIWRNPLTPNHIADLPFTSVQVYDEVVEGKIYMAVFGRPGATGAGGAIPAVPAYLIDQGDVPTSRPAVLMVAGHATKLGTVRVYQDFPEGGGRFESLQTYLTTDDRGRQITAVELPLFDPGGGGVWAREDHTYWTSWVGTAEGMDASIGELLTWHLDKVQGVRIDAEHVALASRRAPAISLSGALTERARAWDVVTRGILPALPRVRLVPTAHGVGVVVVDPAAARSDQRVRLAAGAGEGLVPITAHVGWGKAPDIANRVQVAFGWNARTRGYGRTAAADDLDSQAMYGVRDAQVDSAWVYDLTTADILARDIVAMRGREWPAYTYQANPALYGVEGVAYLQPGTVVGLTDTERGIDGATAIVTGTRRYGADLRVTLSLTARR